MTCWLLDSIKDYERSKGFYKFVPLLGMFSSQDFYKAGHRGHRIDVLGQLLDFVENDYLDEEFGID